MTQEYDFVFCNASDVGVAEMIIDCPVMQELPNDYELSVNIFENAETNNNNLSHLDEEEENNNVQPTQDPSTPRENVRGRKRNPESHKEAKAKQALYAGKAHFNKTGQFRPAPVMRLPCICRQKCGLKMTQEQREEVFKIFNETMGCKDRQWAYIRAHSTKNPVSKTTKGEDQTPSKRKFARKYFFEICVKNEENEEKMKKIDVCKLMFMSTLGIWDGVIDSAYRHINSKNGTPTPDKRGKHKNQPKKTTEQQKESARKHIKFISKDAFALCAIQM